MKDFNQMTLSDLDAEIKQLASTPADEVTVASIKLLALLHENRAIITAYLETGRPEFSHNCPNCKTVSLITVSDRHSKREHCNRCGYNAESFKRPPEKCPGRSHHNHVGASCEGSCCTSCGGPIDDNNECRCG